MAEKASQVDAVEVASVNRKFFVRIDGVNLRGHPFNNGLASHHTFNVLGRLLHDLLLETNLSLGVELYQRIQDSGFCVVWVHVLEEIQDDFKGPIPNHDKLRVKLGLPDHRNDVLGESFVYFLRLPFGLHDFYVHVHKEVPYDLADRVNIREVFDSFGGSYFSIGLKYLLEHFLGQIQNHVCQPWLVDLESPSRLELTVLQTTFD